MADTVSRTPITQLSQTHNSQTLNLPSAALVEHALARGEGSLVAGGALAADTGYFTGRSPRDRFIVRDRLTQDAVAWGAINQPLTGAHFDTLKRDMLSAAADKELFTQDLAAGADPAHRLHVRIVTEYAWHSLFAQICLSAGRAYQPTKRTFQCSVYRVFKPTLKGTERVPKRLSRCRSVKNWCLIGGTEYAGEIKKSIFSVLNFTLPGVGVLPMHCSANVGDDGRSALFFGLSGTGKTTLSADPERTLIGDDEHGWSETGIFNFEGGCYAKVVDLTPEAEPEIYGTTGALGRFWKTSFLTRTPASLTLATPAKPKHPRVVSTRLYP